MSKTSGWVHRKADTDEERFGLLDKPSMMKYRRQPVFQEPVAEPKKSDLVALGFTSGVGSMLFGAQELGFQIAGNIEWRDYYRFRSDEKSKSTFPENFPGAFMSRGLNDTPKDLLPSSIDFLAGHPECLPGVTRIYTSEGWRPIKSIVEGDLVLTHEGRFQPVVRTIKNFLEKGAEFTEIKTSTSAATDSKLNLTSNHPVLTQRGWIPAGEVLVGDKVSVLQHDCLNCGDATPIYRRFCSTSCGNLHQWAVATPEDREVLLRGAHKTTRERCKSKEHQFFDPVVRSNAMRTLAKGKKGSNLERILAWGLDKAGAPKPEAQFAVGKYFLDFAYPEHKIGMEADGKFWHKDLEKDAYRDRMLAEEGWTILRFQEDRIRTDAVGCGEEALRVLSNHKGQYSYAWTEVKAVRKYSAKAGCTVFNLSVLDDHSYVAKGFAVHNCGRFSGLSHSVVNGDGAYKATRADDVSDIPMFIKAVATLRPRFFLMDDLPASFNPFPMQKYVDLLPDYDLFPEWISNFGYGNIQKHRNRMFVVGALKSEKFTFVPGEKNHDLVLKDLIGDLVGSAGDGSIPNHATVDLDYAPGRYVNMRAYGERITWGELQKVFEDSRWSKNLKYYTPAGEEKNRPGTINPRWDGYCPVLSGGYNPLHPIRRLPLTVRERARIQGFPDSFIFYSDAEGPGRKIWEPYNSDGQRGVKQTGKAMPLQFCTFVADQVKHKIEGRDFEATGVRLLKPNALVSKAKLDFCEQSGYSDQESACQACWLKDTCHIRRENQTTEKELSV